MASNCQRWLTPAIVRLRASERAATSASAARLKIGGVTSPSITRTGMVTDAHCVRHGSFWFRWSRAVLYASVGASHEISGRARLGLFQQLGWHAAHEVLNCPYSVTRSDQAFQLAQELAVVALALERKRRLP